MFCISRKISFTSERARETGRGIKNRGINVKYRTDGRIRERNGIARTRARNFIIIPEHTEKKFPDEK